jgi:hypothetical protein
MLGTVHVNVFKKTSNDFPPEEYTSLVKIYNFMRSFIKQGNKNFIIGRMVSVIEYEERVIFCQDMQCEFTILDRGGKTEEWKA